MHSARRPVFKLMFGVASSIRNDGARSRSPSSNVGSLLPSKGTRSGYEAQVGSKHNVRMRPDENIRDPRTSPTVYPAHSHIRPPGTKQSTRHSPSGPRAQHGSARQPDCHDHGSRGSVVLASCRRGRVPAAISIMCASVRAQSNSSQHRILPSGERKSQNR